MDQPVRVFLVDDDEDDFVLTRAMLAQAGPGRYALDRAADYAAGLAAVARGAHDIYLIDHRLGGREGTELVAAAVAAGCRAPLILLTGQGDRAADQRALAAGAADFLVKGRVDADLLDRAIRYALGRKRAEDALREANEALERRVAERTAELRQANARLEDEHRRKDLFLATLAHELRNPLGPMRNALHVLRVRGGTGPAAEQAEGILDRQLTHLGRLVDDLLDVSRAARGLVQLQRQRVDLGKLAQEAADDCRPAADRAGLRLTCEIPPAPVRVDADPTRLTQVLDNLLANAVKFTDPGGEVAVAVSVRPVTSDESRVTSQDPTRHPSLVTRQCSVAEVRVRDTGVGFPPGLAPRLFEAFTQVAEARARGRGGLGLGLALVKGLVEQHGGTVEAHSAGPGKGSEFVIHLPLLPIDDCRLPIASPGFEIGNRQSAIQNRKRVLVVEDNKDAADSLRMLLELRGYEVAVAATGTEGVRLGREWGPQVVLCDIGLPELDGYGVARQLRADPATARTCLIAVTGYGQEEDRRRSREAGFDHHLVKPADPAVLERLLAAVQA
jgi:signal transduction histidine kinase